MKNEDTMQVMELQRWLLQKQACNQITKEEMDCIQSQLFDVIGGIAAKLCNDTLKFTPDLAQQLMESISYQIMYGLLDVEDEERMRRIKEIPFMELYDAGHQQLVRAVEEYRRIAEGLKIRHLHLENRGYNDTICKGIPEFFEQYDLLRKAHETPGEFDYPLCTEIKQIRGFLYVKEYLDYLLQEEKFCSEFEEVRIQELLNGFALEAQQLSVNVYELVLANIIGNLLLEKTKDEVHSLSMDQTKQKQLIYLMNSTGLLEMQQRITAKMQELLSEYEFDNGCKEYVMSSLGKMIRRYQQCAWNQTVECYFVSPKPVEVCTASDASGMQKLSPDVLKKLKEELEKCRYTMDKLALVRGQVHNIDDLSEILDECIYGEEARDLFTMLSDETLAALMVKALKGNEKTDGNEYEDSIGWHMELMFGIQSLSAERQANINQMVGRSLQKHEKIHCGRI